MAGPGLPEELEFELEALRATYGDEAITVEPSSGGAVAVSLPATPRHDAEHEQFVAARLVMAVGASYPDEAPRVQLTDAKGAALALEG